MIDITFYADDFDGHQTVDFDSVRGFLFEGHAGFDKFGKDIICSAVSVLVENTVNSISFFTKDVFDCNYSEDSARIQFKIVGDVSPESRLLLKSLLLGITSIHTKTEEECSEQYLNFSFMNSKEV